MREVSARIVQVIQTLVEDNLGPSAGQTRVRWWTLEGQLIGERNLDPPAPQPEPKQEG